MNPGTTRRTHPRKHTVEARADVGCGAGFHPASDFQSARAPRLSTKVGGARDVPARDRPLLSPQSSRQTIGNTAVLKSGVGQDFILRPIFNRPARRRFPPGFVAPEAFPQGIDSCSYRRLWIAKSRGARQECRHGTQECVRHQPTVYSGRKDCGARDVPARDRPPLLATR